MMLSNEEIPCMISTELKASRMNQRYLSKAVECLNMGLCILPSHASFCSNRLAVWVVCVKKRWQNSMFLQSYQIDDGIIMSQNNATDLHFHFKSVKDVPHHL